MARKKMSKSELQALEKQAQRRAAWGNFIAVSRQHRVKSECDKLRTGLKSSGCSQKEINEEVEQFLKRTVSSQVLIG